MTEVVVFLYFILVFWLMTPVFLGIFSSCALCFGQKGSVGFNLVECLSLRVVYTLLSLLDNSGNTVT